jgi:HD-GYP domain-containing protein (c-di-GMP phosphodiesterase class II)
MAIELVTPEHGNAAKSYAPEQASSNASHPGSPAPARAGYLPVPLDQVLVRALRGMPVYLQTAQEEEERFTLYCAAETRFTEFNRNRLKEAGVRFIYLPMEAHSRFQVQVEKELTDIAADSTVVMQRKSVLVYQTSLALIDAVLAEGMGDKLPRIASISKSVATVAVQSQSFAHLFATAQHDFYTATHMVNVGTWMTSLAFALGETDPGRLETICTAGMLHDVGKQAVPSTLLNKSERLSDCEMEKLRTHPTAGTDQLRGQNITDEVILRVTEEHHERPDGSGYPKNLKGDRIHPVSLICAVVDSFEAMTAARPYRNRVRSIAEAMKTLQSECPDKYDQKVVDTWISMLKNASESGILRDSIVEDQTVGRRKYSRFAINCPIVLRELTSCGDTWIEGVPTAGKARNISKTGIGILLDKELKLGTYVRVGLKGKGTLKDRMCEGLVLRCRQFEDGAIDIGIRFCKPGDQEAAARSVSNN